MHFFLSLHTSASLPAVSGYEIMSVLYLPGHTYWGLQCMYGFLVGKVMAPSQQLATQCKCVISFDNKPVQGLTYFYSLFNPVFPFIPLAKGSGSVPIPRTQS